MQKLLECNEESKGSLPAPSIFEMNVKGCFDLCEGVQLHMFISQPPCGAACVNGLDQHPASMLPSTLSGLSADAAKMQQNQPETQHDCDKHGNGGERLVGDSSGCPPAVSTGTAMPAVNTEFWQLGRLSRASATQHSRSAHQEQQPSTATQQGQRIITAPHQAQHLTTAHQQGPPLLTTAPCAGGGLCRKPGRGDTTLSMSCSDKLARWGLLGVQVCSGWFVYMLLPLSVPLKLLLQNMQQLTSNV